jgi:hypothetical protein
MKVMREMFLLNPLGPGFGEGAVPGIDHRPILRIKSNQEPRALSENVWPVSPGGSNLKESLMVKTILDPC